MDAWQTLDPLSSSQLPLHAWQTLDSLPGSCSTMVVMAVLCSCTQLPAESLLDRQPCCKASSDSHPVWRISRPAPTFTQSEESSCDCCTLHKGVLASNRASVYPELQVVDCHPGLSCYQVSAATWPVSAGLYGPLQCGPRSILLTDTVCRVGWLQYSCSLPT